jgi:indole-3-glycerol phosphate synthase
MNPEINPVKNTHILDKILAFKRRDIAQRKEEIPLHILKKSIKKSKKNRSLYHRMKESRIFHFICEIKKASPSRGLIQRDFDPVRQANFYYKGGASAISVLTEEHFFLGHPDYIRLVRQTVPLPILCKDFIIDPYQIWQAKLYGADIILLIAALLSREQIQELSSVAETCGLDLLLELHSEEDIQKIPDNKNMILGINNRNLKTFQVNLETSFTLRPSLPDDTMVISESGIQTSQICRKLYENGFRGVLIGESLMRSPDPAGLLTSFKSVVENL